MVNKVYQLTSEQIGVVQFDKPWFLVHVGVDNNVHQCQMLYPSLEKGIKEFAKIFEDNVLNYWRKEGPEGEARIERLRQYLLKTWFNPGVETMRKALYEQYGFSELKNTTGKDLIYDGTDFLSLTVAHVALRLNKKHFWFEKMHVAVHVVEKFLSVNFWDKLRRESLNKLGTTVLK